MVTLALNSTKTIQRKAQLEDARDRAEATNRAKPAFLANMSHKIRTPMNGVVGMAQPLEETGLDDEQRLHVKTIRISGEALPAIINDILDYSQIESEKLELHPEPFDLERCIQEIVTLLRPASQDKGPERLPEQGPCSVPPSALRSRRSPGRIGCPDRTAAERQLA